MKPAAIRHGIRLRTGTEPFSACSYIYLYDPKDVYVFTNE